MTAPPYDTPPIRRSFEPLTDGGMRDPHNRYPEPILPPALDTLDRRQVLRLVVAALGAAGSGACNPSSRHGAPLYSAPHGTPGLPAGTPMVFATSLELDGLGRGVLVQTRAGHPIKIEGNPQHPASLGATDAFLQSDLLGLYDPDRSRAPRENGAERSWNVARAMMATTRAEIAARNGRGLAIVTGPVGSPTMARTLDRLMKTWPEARWFAHAGISDANERAGAMLAFGRNVDTVLDLGAADVVVSLGADVLGAGPAQIRYGADFAARRRRGRTEGRMPRLVTMEAVPTLTGTRSDQRIVLPPADWEPFARALAAAMGLAGARASAPDDHPAVASIADDLVKAGTAGLVVAGREQSAAVHALAHAANALLGAVGRTVRFIEPVRASAGDTVGTISQFAEAVASGAITHAVFLDTNPVYSAPRDLDLARLVGRLPFSLHVGLGYDETAVACRWHVPARHPLESWGDTVAFDGTAGLCQPAVLPRIEAVAPLEVLALLMAAPGSEENGHTLVRATWQQRWGGDAEAHWLTALEVGIVADTAAPPITPTIRPDALAGLGVGPAGQSQRPTSSDWTAVLAPDPCLWDGQYANNAWLQELPKPSSKQVWGNAATLAPASADALGLATGDILRIGVGRASIEIPLSILPGQAPGTIGLTLGYGRSGAGRIGSGVGVDVSVLRTASAAWIVDDITIATTGRRGAIITTQHHGTLQESHGLVRTVSATAPSAEKPDEARAQQPSLYPEWPYPGRAWGMTVDLDACIGCNACVVACQSENNIPVVGPQEAALGRVMHWLRIDRYWSGPRDAPETYHQPMLCMHCENAPCEVVCPVNATVHDSEGLNVMVYNRCIGTRTCSNNCPYKVRRFNWFDYAEGKFAAPGELHNPEVTVRRLGVMEKCTFCVQRIKAATIAADMEGRPVRDGEVVTACQQACPTRAFTFGDVNDPASTVSVQKADPRNYAALGDLGTRPRTTYLARVAGRSGGGP